MQYLESSLTGVRSAAIELGRRQTPLRFLLLPMVHIGCPEFYQDVTRRLEDCDLVVAEGITGPSAVATELTLADRLPAHHKRHGLVVQAIDFRSLGVPVISPDFTSAQLRARWRTIPLVHRLLVWILVPTYALWFTLRGTRRVLGRYLGQDDIDTDEQSQARAIAPKLSTIIVDERDQRLVEALGRIHDERCNEAIKVAVVYGAGHMPGVVAAMFARNQYKANSAEWMTVFEY